LVYIILSTKFTMAFIFQQSVDTLVFLKNIMGLKKNITIDSGIFKHLLSDERCLFDKSNDIIEIFGNEDKEIDLDDVIEAFEEMQKQFDELGDSGRSYYFEGIGCDKPENGYHIKWGS